MKKIVGLIVFVAVVIGGYFIWQEMQKTENTDDAEVDGNVVSISARVAGHVSEVLVEDGQIVKKGDVLVKLDPKDFQIAIERAKADVNNELANLQTSRNDVPLTTATTNSTLNGAKSTRQDAVEAINYAQRRVGPVGHRRDAHRAQGTQHAAGARANQRDRRPVDYA